VTHHLQGHGMQDGYPWCAEWKDGDEICYSPDTVTCPRCLRLAKMFGNQATQRLGVLNIADTDLVQ